MNRYTLKSPLTQLVVKKLLPVPLFGLTSAFTVVAVRSPEFENGIEVMDRNGKVLGVSKKAGEKAVKETALSRGVLFGTAFFLPAVLMHFVERSNFAKNFPCFGFSESASHYVSTSRDATSITQYVPTVW
uniref:Uncharacterized protein n=1 Tax=Anas platyrhynchos TaxID=8839 RepID=A0A8B9SKP4_ANAPL